MKYKICLNNENIKKNLVHAVHTFTQKSINQEWNRTIDLWQLTIIDSYQIIM